MTKEGRVTTSASRPSKSSQTFNNVRRFVATRPSDSPQFIPLGGGTIFSAAATDAAVPCPGVVEFARDTRLTRREQQVLWLTRKCLKNKTIAKQLGISFETVRYHIREIHRKTGTADKSELVDLGWRYCLQHLKAEFEKKLQNPPV
jgi:DNA-binding CsgD family transcriptional regulator